MSRTDDVRDLLPLYALGFLEPDEAAVVERAVRRDPALAAELATFDRTADRLLDGLTPVAPPAALRDRLLASVGGSRFERFAARVAEIYDVAIDRARELLGLIEDPKTHEPAFPNAALIHFTGGPACAGADCGFIILKAGETFPWHRHEGDEVVLVLQGTLLDGDGRVTRAGEEDHRGAGTEHEFRAADGDDLIFCARVWGVNWDVQKPS